VTIGPSCHRLFPKSGRRAEKAYQYARQARIVARMDSTNTYLNFALWGLALICAAGIGVAVWVS
jgi:hypothetical protein